MRGGVGRPALRRAPGFALRTLGVLLLGATLVAGCSLAGVPPREPPPPGPEPTAPARPGDAPSGQVRGGESGARPSGDRPANPDRLHLFDETRALWVVRTTLTHPDSARSMVERAYDAGFNTLLVQVRGRGDAWYRPRWEPRAEQLQERSDSYDPLAVVIAEAHGRGMAVHAWVNVHLVGGMAGAPEGRGHLMNARPDLLAVPEELAGRLFDRDPRDPSYVETLVRWANENRETVEGVYTNPAHPEVKEHVHAVAVDLVERYAVDGVHLDYVRYPGPQFDYSRESLLRFREWVWPRLEADRREDLDRRFPGDPLAFTRAEPELWDAFRREQITELVTRVYHGVKKRRPEALVSAAVFSNRVDAFRFRYQDWAGWLRSGVMDVVALMAYTSEDDTFARQVRRAAEAVGRERVWAGIGAYRNTVDGTLRKIEAARSIGTQGVVLFSYDWVARDAAAAGAEEDYLERVGEEAFGGRR